MFNALDLDIESIQDGTLHSRQSENKTSPGAEESTPEEEVLELFNYINNGLVSLGFIAEDEDITSQQADVLLGICRIIEATFDY